MPNSWIGQRYHDCWITRKRDASDYAPIYLKGLTLLPSHRNYANIARPFGDHDSDGQNLQHYMSDSPWPAPKLFTRRRVVFAKD
jgi:hypothetical protein